MSFEGFYINLKSCSDRRNSINNNLEKLGLTKYISRFDAYETKNSDNWMVCKSKGEYGLWISILNCLKEIESKNYKGKYILIMEDDFCFNNNSLERLGNLKHILENEEKNIDILFLDYLINIPFFRCICLEKEKKNLEKDSSKEIFYDSKYFYYACTSCFLIKKLSAPKIFEILKIYFKKGQKSKHLIPIDMALREIIKSNLLNSKLVVPPLGTSDWIQDQSSLIQTGSNNSIRRAQRAYLLIRCAASNNYSINFCIKEFSKLIDEDLDLEKYKTLNDFYKLFKEKSFKFANF